MPIAKALDKKWLHRELDRDLRRKAREKLVELRKQLREARVQRSQAIKNAKERCRSERLAARERARALRVRALAELREAVRLERQSARDACTTSKTEARKMDGIERHRAELAAEQQYQRDMRRIERANKVRHKDHPHVTYIERRAESDDEVRTNIPPELVALFERVKRGIKATPRMTRTETFLHYAEENPREVLDAVDDRTEALVRELEAQEREHARTVRRGPRQAIRRPMYTPEQLAEVPF